MYLSRLAELRDGRLLVALASTLGASDLFFVSHKLQKALPRRHSTQGVISGKLRGPRMYVGRSREGVVKKGLLY